MNADRQASKAIYPALVAMVFVFGWMIRIPYASLLMSAGGDIPSMAMAGMRLRDTDPFAISNIADNTFFRIMAYTRGYTRCIVPFLSYEFVFDLLRFPITERALIYIHAFWGMLSILAIFLFFRQWTDRSASLIGMLLLAVAPELIATNRAFLDPFGCEFFFFYGSLAALSKFLASGENRYRILHAVGLFFYLGAGNTVLVGLALQVLFFFLAVPEKSVPDKLRRISSYARRWSSIVFIIIPLAGLLLAAVVFYLRPSLGTGSIVHILRDRSDVKQLAAMNFQWLAFLKFMPEEIGLIVYLFPLALILMAAENRRSMFSTEKLFLFAYALLFSFLIISGGRPRNPYQAMLTPPIVGLACMASSKRSFRILLCICAALTALISCYDIYGAGRFERKVYPQGRRITQDSGMKTLAYLIRSGELPVSQEKFGSGRSNRIRIRDGLFIDYEGAWYYLSAYYNPWPAVAAPGDVFAKYVQPLIVYRDGVDREDNQRLLAWAKSHQWSQIGTIKDHDKPLMQVFTNISRPPRTYDIAIYNELFDRSYANLPDMAHSWLGDQ